MLADQLAEVFVWGYHEHLKPLLFSLLRKGSDKVVGLIAFLNNNRNVHGL